jgi:membrane-associated phospholipid phosphatase
MLSVITEFADQSVILPLVVVVAVIIAASRWWRGVAAWLVAVAVSFGIVLALKLFFAACPWHMPGEVVRSPSGHVVAATMVYGGLVFLLTGRRLAALIVAAVVALLIAYTRIRLGAHDLVEVVIGAGAGLLGVLALIGLAGRHPGTLRHLPAAAVVVGVLVLLGYQLKFETAIARAAYTYVWPLLACRRA